MTLYFVTGNKNKYKEVKAILPQIKWLKKELPEIQEFDVRKIIRYKLKQALKYKKGEFIIEDTGLYIDALKGLPGPLIKWFLDKMGTKGIYNTVKNLNKRAEATTVIGYAKGSEVHFFTGTVKGRIVKPRGHTAFGWDPIFQPEDYRQTFAEMSQKEKSEISMRRIALKKLKHFLKTGK